MVNSGFLFQEFPAKVNKLSQFRNDSKNRRDISSKDEQFGLQV